MAIKEEFHHLSIPFYIARASNVLRLRLHRSFKEKGYNITPDQWGILNTLWRKDGRTQREISKKISKDTSSVTRMLDLLEKENYVERRRNENDRRSYRIFLTSKGKRVKNKLISIVEETHEISLNGLNNEKRKMLINMLDTICEKKMK